MIQLIKDLHQSFIRNKNHHFFYFRINVAGNWIPVSYNPGLHARNRYGHHIYKHSQHWLELGMPSCKWELWKLLILVHFCTMKRTIWNWVNLIRIFLLTGKSDGWLPYSIKKDFSSCIRPGHQACLDQYQTDGNIQFRIIAPWYSNVCLLKLWYLSLRPINKNVRFRPHLLGHWNNIWAI